MKRKLQLKKPPRKWEFINIALKRCKEEFEEKPRMIEISQLIFEASVQAYPHAPTTKAWEEDYAKYRKNGKWQHPIPIEGIIDIALDGCYCIGCEMTDPIDQQSCNCCFTDPCDYCRINPLISPDKSGCDGDSFFGEFDSLAERALRRMRRTHWDYRLREERQKELRSILDEMIQENEKT